MTLFFWYFFLKLSAGRGIWRVKVSLRWFISNCSGYENLLKLPRGRRLWDILIVKTEKSWCHRTRFEDITSAICHLFPHMVQSWPLYELQEQSKLLNRYWIFLTRILLKCLSIVIYTTKHGILANQKPLTCKYVFSHLPRHVILGSTREQCKIIICRYDM
jgi:hypothetical protein